jgi:drug/metabolite transporter, DME family
VHLDVGVSASLLYLGIVSTALAYGLFFAGLHSTPTEVASVLTLLEPLTATGLAVVLLGEGLPPAGLLGALLLLVAVGVLFLRPTPQSAVALPGTGPV